MLEATDCIVESMAWLQKMPWIYAMVAQIRISGTSLEFFSRKECVTPGSNMVFWSPDMNKIFSKKKTIKYFQKKKSLVENEKSTF